MAEGGQGQVTFISNRPTQLMCGFFFFSLNLKFPFVNTIISLFSFL